MIDISQLAAAPLPGVSTPGQQEGGVGDSPSTADFLQMMEGFLAEIGSAVVGSALPALLNPEQEGPAQKSTDLLALLGAVGNPKISGTEAVVDGVIQDVGTADAPAQEQLDPAQSELLAQLLQSLGFGVTPKDLQALSPLDREQLGSALEFVRRNLQSGAQPEAVLEASTVLMPRAWPFKGIPEPAAPSLPNLAAGEAKPSLLAPKVATETVNSLQELASRAARIAQKRGEAPNDAAVAQNTENGLAQAVSKQHAMTEHARVESPGAIDRPVLAGRQGGLASEFIGRQFLEKVQVQLSEGRRELKLKLWPEELGEVRLSLRMGEGDRVDARLSVQSETVRQALIDATPQLREALSRHGLELERLSVSVDAQSAESGTTGQGNQGQGDQKSGRHGGWQEEEIQTHRSVVLGLDTGRRNGRNTIDMWS